MTAERGLAERFRRVTEETGGLAPGAPIVVAVSGGLDSCVLLHLTRFALSRPPDIVVGHFDHGLREESTDDAAWVRGLTRAWGVAFRGGRAEARPASEAAAREARYAFLERTRAESGADVVLVAHHADDQAETVLHRILRGTGTAGLAAIPRSREPGILRPLLGVWREDLEAYAADVRLSWRDDTSNAELEFARNALRHRLIPDAERLVAPGARRALVRLAAIAARDETAWRWVVDDVVGRLDLEEHADRFTFDRAGCVALPAGLRARVLRALAARFGLDVDEAGTRLAVEFTSGGRSGGRIELGGGVELRRELDRLVVGRTRAPGLQRQVRIAGAGPGAAVAVVADSRFDVSWGDAVAEGHRWAERFVLRPARFPVVVRGPEPGDRIRLAGGSKKLKKLFLEARIPVSERRRTPVVVDADGGILWVPGVARAARANEDEEGTVVTIGIG